MNSEHFFLTVATVLVTIALLARTEPTAALALLAGLIAVLVAAARRIRRG